MALYGVDILIEEKQNDKRIIGEGDFDVESIRLSEEVFQQINFLNKMKEMAQMYGYDISEPAHNAVSYTHLRLWQLPLLCCFSWFGVII